MRPFHLTRQRAIGLSLAVILLAVTIGMLPTITLAQSSQSARHVASGNGFAVAGTYRLLATEIDGQDAHLSLLPDPLYPALTFTATTIKGLAITHAINTTTSVTLSATTATTTAVTIKTSVFNDLTTALGSFADKVDLLTLIAGGTVKLLKMTNVNLTIDRSMTVASTNQTTFRIVVTAGVVGGASPVPPGTSTPVAGVTSTPSVGATVTPTITGTPGAQPTPTKGAAPTPTLTPQPTTMPKPTTIPTPPPVTNWLQIVPTTLNLTCGQSVNVTLKNLGATTVFWTVAVPFLGDIVVSPTSGWLASGASVTIKVTNTALLLSHQDTLVFTAYNSHAGQPAKLSYTLKPCL